jgi:hypothetical protein
MCFDLTAKGEEVCVCERDGGHEASQLRLLVHHMVGFED